MSLSIIIPSTGERSSILIETIEAALSAIEGLDAEVIVIKRNEKNISIKHPKLVIVNVEFNNVSASRNLGAKLAKNELLLFIDDDIILSSANVFKFVAVDAQMPQPYLLAAPWVHTSKVKYLKKNTFLGQMLALYFPNDSFKTRYNKVSLLHEWQDNRLFKSSMKAFFWELCFSIRRHDYQRVGGMPELFNFGNEGVDFLKRILSGEILYYVDATNIVLHNEWDKFDNWSIPEKRWRVEAQLVNDKKGFIKATQKNYFYKLFYGTFIYSFSFLLRKLLHSLSFKNHLANVSFKLFDMYLTSIYWNQIKWSTIWELQHTDN